MTVRSYPHLDYPIYVDPGLTRCEADRVLDATETAIKTRSDLGFPEWVQMGLSALHIVPKSDRPRDLVRQGLDGPAMQTAFANQFGQSFRDGYTKSPDTLAALYDVQPAPPSCRN